MSVALSIVIRLVGAAGMMIIGTREARDLAREVSEREVRSKYSKIDFIGILKSNR